MRPHDGSLIPSLTQYRKRKRSSLDGSIAGVEYNRWVPGAGTTLNQPQHGLGSPHPFAEYDPTVAHYDLNGPEYNAPTPWFEGMTQPPSMPVSEARFSDHMSIVEPLPQAVSYEDSLMTSGLTEGAWADRSITELRLEHGGLEESLEAEPQGSGLEILADDPLVATLGPEESLDQTLQAPFEEMQAMCDQQQAFEDHAQMQPQELDPCMMAQQIYDEQMQQLQNPFMMPGFGPGP